MQLETRLTQAERFQKLTKRTAMAAMLLAAGLFPIVASGGLGSADPYDNNANVLSISLAVLFWLASVVAALGVASFYSRFVPQARQAREDLRDEMLREMRAELTLLREQVANLKQSR